MAGCTSDLANDNMLADGQDCGMTAGSGVVCLIHSMTTGCYCLLALHLELCATPYFHERFFSTFTFEVVANLFPLLILRCLVSLVPYIPILLPPMPQARAQKFETSYLVRLEASAQACSLMLSSNSS